MMTAREGRPLLLIDLAVPRDIHPDCRDLEGVSLHDMDDLQTLVERNASGREAEARRAESVFAPSWPLRALARLQDVVPTVAALRERADEIVDQVLAENEPRWEALSEADRERMRGDGAGDREPPAARADPAARSAPRARTTRTSTSSALRELFGLDAGTRRSRRGTPRCARCARRAGARPANWRPAEAGNAGRRARPGAGAAVAEALGGAEVVAVKSSGDAPSPATRSASSAGSSRRCWTGEVDLAVHSAKDLPESCPTSLRLGGGARPRGTRGRVRRRASSLDELPEAARVGTAACAGAPSSWRCGRISTWWSCVATSTPGWASCRGGFDGSWSPPRAFAVSTRGRDRLRLRARGADARRGQGSLALEARRDDPDAAAAAASISDHDALVELTAERAAVATLQATCHTPVGICARLDGDELTMHGFAGLPDGSEWVRDRVTGDPEQPAALEEALAERLLAAGAGPILERAETAA